MKNYLIIHGHFYQPPREDPDTGTIPRQPSASPYRNWNERITRECYAANAFSRILGPDGRITEIVNNYKYLSFNFGPTLFHWLRENAPTVYERILEADRVSVERNSGHGNGIAQGYNHTILPLDTPANCETQIEWGVEDFRFHFGRDPEGIWLPETAVNGRVLDCLIARGIKFIILSPWQAAGWREANTKKWHEVTDEPISSERAYFLKRPGGTISVFFYNHVLASGISFNHFLHNADTLYEKLHSFANFKRKGHLISIATDGEIYGHHEPYGDMCIAALSKKILTKKEFILTNYGAYLEEFPPTAEVRLKKGEEDRGTSWSCHHGVSRWYKDCGCSTGGREEWNQKWRGPMRGALAGLFDAAYAVYEEEMGKLSDTDPKEIRNRYISVLTGAVSPEEFVRTYLTKKKTEDVEIRTRFLSLLEGQKYGMFMFTSCGWFFADISGLEPVQNLKYAYRTVQLYQPFSQEELLSVLKDRMAEARSNIDALGKGKDIMKNRVIERWRSTEYTAAVFTVLFHIQHREMSRSFGFYLCREIENLEENKTVLTIQQKFTGMSTGYTAEITGEESGPLSVTVNTTSNGGAVTIHGYTLPVFVREILYRHLSKKAAAGCSRFGTDILELLENNFSAAGSLKVPIPEYLKSTAETFLLSRLYMITHTENDNEPKVQEQFIRALILLNRHHVPFPREEVKRGVSSLISRRIEKIIEAPEDEQIRDCLNLLEGLRRGEIEPDITIAQNRLYGYLRTMSFILSSGRKDRFPDRKTLMLLPEMARLGNQIGLDADRMKEQFISWRERS